MKHISSIFIITILLVFSSCSDFLDVNTDPNNPSPEVIEPGLVLPSAQMQIAGSLNGTYAIVGGMWSQHWTQSNASSQFRNEDRYALTNSSSIYQTAWRDLYSDALIDLKFVKDKAEESGEWNSYLQASCMMAYTYQVLADFYGQIPFTEALQGADLAEPAFDSGEKVYDGLITMIDGALAKDFSESTVKPFPSDFLFGHMGKSDQIDAWKKFANTLKLKIFLRQSEARPNVASTGATGLLNADLLDGAASIDVFTDAAGLSNPFFESTFRQLNTDGNLRASTTLFSWLEANGDSRMDAYFTPGAAGHHSLAQGNFNAPSGDEPPTNVDKTNPSPSRAFYFFTADEVAFLKAEAELRYGNAASAKTSYNNGVMAAFQRFGLDGSSILGGVYAYPDGSFNDNLKAIMTQKWAASIERGYESFFDQNRTGIPAISSVPTTDGSYVPGEFTYSLTGTTNGAFPQRLIFPDRERRVNSNTPAEVAITVPVWWAN